MPRDGKAEIEARASSSASFVVCPTFIGFANAKVGRGGLGINRVLDCVTISYPESR
jgi:hypothetical protein